MPDCVSLVLTSNTTGPLRDALLARGWLGTGPLPHPPASMAQGRGRQGGGRQGGQGGSRWQGSSSSVEGAAQARHPRPSPLLLPPPLLPSLRVDSSPPLARLRWGAKGRLWHAASQPRPPPPPRPRRTPRQRRSPQSRRAGTQCTTRTALRAARLCNDVYVPEVSGPCRPRTPLLADPPPPSSPGARSSPATRRSCCFGACGGTRGLAWAPSGAERCLRAQGHASLACACGHPLGDVRARAEGPPERRTPRSRAWGASSPRRGSALRPGGSGASALRPSPASRRYSSSRGRVRARRRRPLGQTARGVAASSLTHWCVARGSGAVSESALRPPLPPRCSPKE